MINSQPSDLSILSDVSDAVCGSTATDNHTDVSTGESSSKEKGGWIYRYQVAYTEKDKEAGRILRVCCGANKCNKSYTGSSTGNMIRHLKSKHGITQESMESGGTRLQPGPLDGFLTNSKQQKDVTRDEWREQLARSIVSTKSAYMLVEDEEFRRFVELTARTISPTIVKPITGNTVKADIHKAYLGMRGKVESLLQSQTSLSFSLDLWTSKWGADIFGIKAHFIDDNWNVRDVLIGFEQPEDRHTGEVLAEHFCKTLNSFNIAHLLFTITSDNASNIKKMAQILEEKSSSSSLRYFK